MNFFVDQEKQELVVDGGKKLPLYSKEAFELLSALWVKVGWDQKYIYSFTWMGRPLIQLPDDVLRIQEVIYGLKPDLIIETGVAHGGSLVFYASLCKAMGHGRIVGIDIEIRPHNRAAIERHELSPLITLIENDSIGPEAQQAVRATMKKSDKTVLVILDSCHTYDHVLAELELYGDLVTPGSYIVATDGSQAYLGDTPRARKEYAKASGWDRDNPKRAAEDFAKAHPGKFRIEEPKFPFNEGFVDFRITHWPSAYIKRL